MPHGKVLFFCTDPPQATARLVIVLVSRVQKSGTAWGLRTTVFSNGKGQLVLPTEMSGPVKIDHRQSWSQIFQTEIYGVLG